MNKYLKSNKNRKYGKQLAIPSNDFHYSKNANDQNRKVENRGMTALWSHERPDGRRGHKNRFC